MATAEPKTEKLCIYCGEPATGIREGEHILQKAIGGARTIVETSGRLVCHPCNNGVLSQVDNELCGRSYLALVASQEIDASLWQAWDMDHASGNQLVEAKPTWREGVLEGLYCYPQMIFESGGMGIRGDAREINQFGNDNFEHVLARAVYSSFQRFNAGAKKKGLFFEQIDRDVVERGYRYDPRVFTRHTIAEIARNIEKQTFTLRYASQADKRAMLSRLAALEPRRSMSRWTHKHGSRQPPIASIFDLGRTVRGLLKIGFNILAAYCTKTPVDHSAFSGVIRLIRGENHPSPELIAANGFVRAVDLAEMKAPGQGHAFRVTSLGDEWLVYASFFGGRLAAAVGFPGPNHEDWNTLDIVAPIKSREWRVTYSSIVQPIRARIEWSKLEDIAPTIKLQNSYTQLIAEAAPIKPPRQPAH